jgi:pSer/pThr/pTyr-binding forkhead associated (FHA) protein
MHPEDMILFIDYISGLCRQMENWLAEIANERGYTLIDRVRVQIVGDDGVPRRSIQVTAAIAERPELSRAAQDALQRTEVFRVIRATGGVPPLRLRFTEGPRRDQEVMLRKAVTTLGRALDNDIVLDASEASRHHARLEFVNDILQVVDLDSTNGTRVNGQRVTTQRVNPGDEISFGTLKIKLLAFGPDGL